MAARVNVRTFFLQCVEQTRARTRIVYIFYNASAGQRISSFGPWFPDVVMTTWRQKWRWPLCIFNLAQTKAYRRPGNQLMHCMYQHMHIPCDHAVMQNSPGGVLYFYHATPNVGSVNIEIQNNCATPWMVQLCNKTASVIQKAKH